MDGNSVEQVRDLVVHTAIAHPNTVFIAPQDHTVLQPNPYEHWPERPLEQRADLRSPGAFVDYVRRFATDQTVVFVHDGRRSFEARLDFHTGAQDPRPNRHGAQFTLQLHHAFKTWRAFASERRTQVETMEFLEDHMHEVVDPPAADICEVCSSLELTSSGTFKSGQRLADGNVELVYTQETKPSGSLVIPEMLTIKTPVFVGLDPIEWKMRLRYRFRDGAVAFVFVPQNLEQIMDATFARVEASMRAALAEIEPAPLVMSGEV